MTKPRRHNYPKDFNVAVGLQGFDRLCDSGSILKSWMHGERLPWRCVPSQCHLDDVGCNGELFGLTPALTTATACGDRWLSAVIMNTRSVDASKGRNEVKLDRFCVVYSVIRRSLPI